MKRVIVIAAMLAAFGLGGAAAFAATADKPPSPPGQGECEHGNSQQQCKDDPSDHGKDCDQHGKQGGVNEDHCTADSTTTETTTTETTETTETTDTTETTTTESTTTESTPAETTTSTTTESTPTQTSSTETTPSGENEQSPAPAPGAFTPPAQHSGTQKPSAGTTELVSGEASQAAAKPTKAAQPAPFTP
jgi:hypothetical protein